VDPNLLAGFQGQREIALLAMAISEENSMNSSNSSSRLYLDLMKKPLTNWIYGDVEDVTLSSHELVPSSVLSILQNRGIRLVQRQPFNPFARQEGRDWPATAHTMVGLKRLDNLQYCVEQILQNQVPGDLIETGVWRGGASIFMRAILKVYDVTDRCVWLADSFQGLPAPNPQKYPHDAGDHLHTIRYLAVPLDRVMTNFERYDLLDSQVRFLKGGFRDTLPQAPIQHLAILRLDGDLYESTMDALVSLYPKLSQGGFVIVDDYGPMPSCRQAVHDYREEHGIRDPLIPIDWGGVYWQRTS
jgi:O-methyltransferase